MLGEHYNINQGFSKYYELWRKQYELIKRINKHPALFLFKQILEKEKDKPVFAFINFIEPHAPYTPFQPLMKKLVKKNPTRMGGDIHFIQYYLGEKKLTEGDFKRFKDRYDLGIDGHPSQGRNLLDKYDGRDVFCEYYYPKMVLGLFGDRKGIAALGKYKRRLKCVISNNIKLIFSSDGKHELYDLLNDPDELDNLINEAKYSKVKQEYDEQTTSTHQQIQKE